MAEAFGIVSGAMSVAAIFSSCMECFTYIQQGRNFEQDYQNKLIALSLLHVRFSRWGYAVGIDSDVPNPDITPFEETEKTLQNAIKNTLQAILLLFDKFEKKSRKLSSSPSPPSTPTSTKTRAATDIEQSPLSALADTTQEIAESRVKKPGILKRVSWALYEKESLEEIIGEISGFLHQLESLKPAQDVRNRLIEEDFNRIRKLVSFEVLDGLLTGVDADLQQRARKYEAEKGSHRYESIVIKDQARTTNGNVFFGSQYGSSGNRGIPESAFGHVYKSIIVSNDAKAHNGDWHNRSPFD
ncbi:hypothetical protein K4K49_001487 [Colletotrichum sp. SAR 10_70]|nr:hypothetical protein K4K50_013180 [Colletotrichum sp. SAR 10_71]KAI8187494.1 hypothetical protein K4K51_008734 [Colletotrichum sp. SAR 10_75]KAI8200700.1 hypothetical protein K4K49_001487 [Colletotrichum sp. SAR 10_70]KAI8225469.1 hypothetical protein K4K54_004548 [Colletotrichum sp. SAR 10_86]KAJ5005530.1 hypothetical protein K4K48_007024 [Colletotrichum sp. SAR 10_66]